MRPATLFINAVTAAWLLSWTPHAIAAIKAPSTNIPWLAAAAPTDIDTAFAQAKAQNKPVLLYWGATWCPPCNQLKATFFNRQDFAQAANGFIAVHVDGDRPGAQKLGSRFKVGGYPTVVLLSPDGREITRLPGEADPERMMAVLQLGLSGGRPVRDVLADARAGKPLPDGAWRMLAFYSWDTDQDQLVTEADRPEVLADLARKAPAGPGEQADVATRLWLKAVAASDDGKGLKADAALRERVRAVLVDPAAARRHADVLSNNAPEMLRALSEDGSPERQPLASALDAALQRLARDTALSRGDRITALIGRVQIARLGQPKDAVKVNVPAALVSEVRSQVAADDREIRDGYERQAVITAGAYALGQVGLWAESDALLQTNLAKSHSPYYLMSQLGGNARKQGRTADALRWYGEAYAKSEGPATRLQWGTGYLSALVDLAPQDTRRIEQTAAQLIGEAALDDGAFSGRSARVLQRLGRKLGAWGSEPARAAALQRLQAQLDGVCAKVDAADRAACTAVLKPAAG
ncbi:MAG: thioredoxin family protein [Burkholderiaceae bacterium]|nr:thioredoxin family protein [Burkholderiaceae bacterium]